MKFGGRERINITNVELEKFGVQNSSPVIGFPLNCNSILSYQACQIRN